MNYELILKAEEIKEELKLSRKSEIENEFNSTLELLSRELSESQMVTVKNILRYGLVDRIHGIIFDYDKIL